MTEKGKVVDISDGEIGVRFVRTSACASCRKCGMSEDSKEIVLKFDYVEGIAVGDEVFVEMPPASTLISVLLMYVIPLIMLFVGLVIGTLLFKGQSGELYAAALGIALTLLSYTIVKLSEEKIKKLKIFSARLRKTE